MERIWYTILNIKENILSLETNCPKTFEISGLCKGNDYARAELRPSPNKYGSTGGVELMRRNF